MSAEDKRIADAEARASEYDRVIIGHIQRGRYHIAANRAIAGLQSEMAKLRRKGQGHDREADAALMDLLIAGVARNIAINIALNPPWGSRRLKPADAVRIYRRARETGDGSYGVWRAVSPRECRMLPQDIAEPPIS